MKAFRSFLFSIAFLWVCICPAQQIANDSIENSPGKNHLIHQISFTTGIDYIANSIFDELRIPVEPGDWIYSHSDIPVNLRYSFSFTDSKIRNYLPGGYQGIGLGILNIGAGSEGGVRKAASYIGNPVLLYIFQGGPFWDINRRFSLNYEWNFGASFGWRPYSERNYNFNLTVGSKVNAYLNFTAYLNWKISNSISLFGGIALSHFSNGNTSWPNPGVNSLGLKLGLNYVMNPVKRDFYKAAPDTIHKFKLEYDISLWGASRKRAYKGNDEPILLPGHFICSGISFSPMMRLNNWWRTGIALDVQYDQSSDKKKHYISGTNSDDIKFSHPNFFRQISWGLSAHGELQMPIFAVNIGIGYNIYAPRENRGTYQNISLKTYLSRKLFLNVGYQLRNFHQQANLMLGLGLTL